MVLMQACLEYHINYTPGPKIGSGGFGSIYLTSKDDQVMKIVSLKESKMPIPWSDRQPFVREVDFKNEINMQNMFASWGVAVPVEESWIYNNYGVMVMKRLEITLEQFVQAHPGNEELIRDAVGKLSEIHLEHKAHHGDYTDQNIMLDTHNYNNAVVSINVNGQVYYLYLIDFGFADKGEMYDRSRDVDMIIEMMEELFC